MHIKEKGHKAVDLVVDIWVTKMGGYTAGLEHWAFRFLLRLWGQRTGREEERYLQQVLTKKETLKYLQRPAGNIDE